jgi:hypothetical protein
MRKLFFIFFVLSVNIVLLFLSCDDKPEDKNMNETNPEQEVVIKEPIPVSNIRHTKDGNTYKIEWDHDGVDVYEINLTYGCTNGVIGNEDQRGDIFLTKDTRQYTIVNDWNCIHNNLCERLWVGIKVIYVRYPVSPKYQPISARIDYDFAKAE